MSRSAKRILLAIVVIILGAVAVHYGTTSMKSLGEAIHGRPGPRP